MVPSLTSGSRHQDGLPGTGGACVSGGAGRCAAGASASASAAPRWRCDQYAAPPSARITRTEKPPITPLSAIDRNRAQPTSALNTAARVAPSTRPVSSFLPSLSSSPSMGSSSHANP